MTEPKITKEQLKEELEGDKTFKEIAFDHGYGYPSRALSDKVRELGYSKNQKLTVKERGGSTFYVSPSILQDSLDQKDLGDSSQLFFYSTVTEDGNILIKPTDDMWRQEK